MLPLFEILPEMDPATMAAFMASMRWDLMDNLMVELPESNFAASHAHSPLGLSHSFQGLDDPAALLESLAAFDHIPSSNEINTTASNDHFASLLQAAATATGEEAAQNEHDQHEHDQHEQDQHEHDPERESTSQSPTPEQCAPSQNIPGPSPEARRKRTKEERDDTPYGFVANKAARRSSPEDEAEQLAREREIWGPEDNELDLPGTFENQHTPIPGADARAVGVHSAAALFRRPSTASKKYTSKFPS
jgi:hypothetical protein